MLLQAYDFLHLFRERQCTLQVGGSDQWGNITAGVDLIRRVENGEAHGLVAPLVTMASGKKFGKSEEGAIYLDPALTSPYKFYQFWINTDDRDVERFLKLFTPLTPDRVAELMARQEQNPAARAAQTFLATDVTTRAHGADAASSAAAAAGVLFGEFDPRGAGPRVFEILAQEIPTTAVARDVVTLVDALVQAGLAKSKSEARRAIEQGGIYVNQQRAEEITPADWIAGGRLLLRKGKKDYALLKAQ